MSFYLIHIMGQFAQSRPKSWGALLMCPILLCLIVMPQAMKNIKLLGWLIEHGWIHLPHITCSHFVYISILWCTTVIPSHFWSCSGSPMLIATEILTTVVCSNKVESWLGLFEILWWHNDYNWVPRNWKMAAYPRGIANRKIVTQWYRTCTNSVVLFEATTASETVKQY